METIPIQNEILSEVKRLIVEIIGQEHDLQDREIDLETSFSKDLELESIEFVVLSEKLQTLYGNDVNFSNWLAEKELDQIIHLKVQDIVEFIARCRS